MQLRLQRTTTHRLNGPPIFYKVWESDNSIFSSLIDSSYHPGLQLSVAVNSLLSGYTVHILIPYKNCDLFTLILHKMYPRTLQTFTLLLLCVTLVLSTPTPVPVPEPIDKKIAQVVAENNNLGCSQGCSGVNGTVDAISSSGAVSATTKGTSNALAAAAAVAGGLSAIAVLV
ncbi:hypothetical protein BKA93DRAFT_820743 [Sparassis latifolia]|uniref:Uncharacterized protein n=1 Tax=Sparassis crispa TaxID=139825 RepID=A0A401GG04_9APHY|nr:hypothetical protein SCP_0307790 [Sparassis crispa]GBE81055.1 hypothetical protein SCP_0307790 [Sparassis crispa]